MLTMLSGPQLKQLAAADSHRHSSPSRSDSSPVIAVTRPSLVSALVDENDLSLIRAQHNEQNRNRSSSLYVSNLHQINNQLSRSAQNSPKLQRRSSFRKKKFISPSHNVEGYEALNSDFASGANQFSREKVTSVHRVLSRNNSFTSTPQSPRPYRAKMNLVPAKHRVVQSDSSDDEDLTDDLVNPFGESSLDFGSGTRTPSRVSFLVESYVCMHTCTYSIARPCLFIRLAQSFNFEILVCGAYPLPAGIIRRQLLFAL